MLPSVRARILVLALAAGLVSCGDDTADADRAELEALRQEVDALIERDIEREERLTELEATAERLVRDDPSARLGDTERELAQVVETLTLIDEELAAAVTDGAQHDAEVASTTEELAKRDAVLEGTIGEVREQLATTRSRLDRVDGQLEDLGIRYETLRDRIDRLGQSG